MKSCNDCLKNAWGVLYPLRHPLIKFFKKTIFMGNLFFIAVIISPQKAISWIFNTVNLSCIFEIQSPRHQFEVLMSTKTFGVAITSIHLFNTRPNRDYKLSAKISRFRKSIAVRNNFELVKRMRTANVRPKISQSCLQISACRPTSKHPDRIQVLSAALTISFWFSCRKSETANPSTKIVKPFCLKWI